MIEIPAAPTIRAKKPPAILSLIGETPLVEITQFDTGPCQLFLKLENQNPTGSIKDRIALSMIEAAEEEGKLEPGGTVIEATAGNTGLGLALVAAAKGYHVVLVIPDKMSQANISDARGLGRFCNRVKPRRGIEMVLADPTGSVLYEYVKTGKLVESGSWAVEGIGEDFIPEIADMSLVTDAFEIDDEESFAIARDLLRKEGIFGGSSTGTLVAGALRYCRQQTQPKRVVSFVADTGNKYLSKMYNDFWMAEQGYIHRPPHGDLSDLISHRYEAGEVITVGADDTLLTAFKRMRDSDVSQLPVVDQNGRALGIIDESDLLVKVHRDPTHFNDAVKTAMTNKLETLPPKAKIKDLLDVFDRGRVAIVMEDDKLIPPGSPMNVALPIWKAALVDSHLRQDWPQWPPCWRCSIAARTLSPATICTAAHSACLTECAAVRPILILRI